MVEISETPDEQARHTETRECVERGEHSPNFPQSLTFRSTDEVGCLVRNEAHASPVSATASEGSVGRLASCVVPADNFFPAYLRAEVEKLIGKNIMRCSRVQNSSKELTQRCTSADKDPNGTTCEQ